MIYCYSIVSAVQWLVCEIMHALHPNYNRPGDSVDPHVSVFLRFLCRKTDLNVVLVSSSALLSTHQVWFSSAGLTSTIWGQYRARKASAVAPRGALSTTKWKFIFGICMRLTLFKSTLYQCKYHVNDFLLESTDTNTKNTARFFFVSDLKTCEKQTQLH